MAPESYNVRLRWRQAKEASDDRYSSRFNLTVGRLSLLAAAGTADAANAADAAA